MSRDVSHGRAQCPTHGDCLISQAVSQLLLGSCSPPPQLGFGTRACCKAHSWDSRSDGHVLMLLNPHPCIIFEAEFLVLRKKGLSY